MDLTSTVMERSNAAHNFLCVPTNLQTSVNQMHGQIGGGGGGGLVIKPRTEQNETKWKRSSKVWTRV